MVEELTVKQTSLDAAAEAGRRVAATWPPLTDQQVDAAATILAGVVREKMGERL